MIQWLIKKYVPDYQDTNSLKVRSAVGRICAAVGIVLNIFLFLSKYFVGVMVSSVSIKADAINNLSDGVNSLVSIVVFHIAEKPADKGHPYGHERTETVTSLFIGIAIALVGYEMLSQSIEKIMKPTPVDFSMAAIGVLVLSIAVKMLMYLYNRKYGKKYHSSLMEANALDSRSDCLSTGAVLLSTLISPLIHFNLDGYMGVLVSLIIFYSAYSLLKDMINSLLGEAPDPKLVDKIKSEIMKNDVVLAVHDIVIHSYGPNSKFATAHVEVDGNLNIVYVHDEIDRIERKIKNDMGINLTLHVDPMLLDDPMTRKYLNKVRHVIHTMNPNWKFHDFHLVETEKKIKLFFDLVVPFDEKMSEKEIEHKLMDHIYTKKPIEIIINLDHPYD